MKITGTERIRAALEGRRTDRVPYSFWTHLSAVDLDAEKLAEETIRFWKRYDLDFIKTMPNGMFSVEDMGCECDYSEVANGGVAKVRKFAVKRPDDWLELAQPDIGKGALGRELRSLKLILDHVRDEAPVVVTVFSPLTTALKLCGPDLLAHMQQHPGKLRAGLEQITATARQYARAAVELGAAGIFFASQTCGRDFLTEEEYKEFSLSYDYSILNEVRGRSWFNVIHIHGTDTHHRLLYDLPAQALNWHIGETAPSIAEFAQSNQDKLIVGGLNRMDITNGNLTALREQIREAVTSLHARRRILAPGCTIRGPLRDRSLRQLSQMMQNISSKEERNVHNM
ncbi:uroporphyrinogen decarboxylase family protein [Paenibacillus macerans]|uniref:uroporphyrinogen decarboxylase family protein n=1 Tax=Paenibacillus macerans TaxID=44252 RepID=UPI002E23BBB1|nr:uroporphyrinogen decarboxylase family protein [Paenibacillus macerans]MED4957372.1 uroporphyrinogen decarboxylase family protein [Paenibacillus macerans]